MNKISHSNQFSSPFLFLSPDCHCSLGSVERAFIFLFRKKYILKIYNVQLVSIWNENMKLHEDRNMKIEISKTVSDVNVRRSFYCSCKHVLILSAHRSRSLLASQKFWHNFYVWMSGKFAILIQECIQKMRETMKYKIWHTIFALYKVLCIKYSPM